MRYYCKEAKLFKFEEDGPLHQVAGFVANEGQFNQRMITITQEGIRFKVGEFYDLNVQVDEIPIGDMPLMTKEEFER